MKVKRFISDLLKGMLIGISMIVPGLSGGVIALILNVYQKIIDAINSLFKTFKKSFLILLPLGIGGLIGLIALVFPLKVAFENYFIMIITLFAGFIIGSIPSITSKIDRSKVKPYHYLISIFFGLLSIGLGLLSVFNKFDLSAYFDFVNGIDVWVYFFLVLVGLLTAFALVSPGISSSIWLIVLGVYTPLLGLVDPLFESLRNTDFGTFFNIILIYGCFLLGLIVGCFVFSKLVGFLLNKQPTIFYFAVLGFVITSVVSCYLNNDFVQYINRPQGILPYEIVISVVLLLVGFTISFLLVRYEKKHQNQIKNEDLTEDSKEVRK